MILFLTAAEERIAVRRQYVHQIWRADPAVYAPPRYRRACEYDAV